MARPPTEKEPGLRPFVWSLNRRVARLEPSLIERPVVLCAWHWGIAAFLFAAGLIYGSLLPFDFLSLSFAEAWRSFQSLHAADPASSSSQDFAINVLIVVPLSFSLMGALLLRRKGNFALFAGAFATLAICFLVSCSVEFTQLWIDSRVSSFRDISAQLCGASVGVLIWLSVGPRISDQLEEFLQSREPASRVVWILNAYVIGVVIWSLLPFDFITEIHEIGRKYRDGRIEIVPFTYQFSTSFRFWYSVAGQAVLFIPVGVWSVVAWVSHKSTIRSPWTALAFCLTANVAVELAQLFIKSRYTSSRDMLMGSLGCAVGIWAVHLWKLRQGHTESPGRFAAVRETGFWLVASFAYSLVLWGIAWAPFEFTRDQSLIHRRLRTFADIPFRMMQASGSDVGALFHIIRNFGWYVPLGVLVAVAADRVSSPRSRWLTIILAASAISAVAITSVAGQFLLPGDHADLTDVIIRAMGGFAGLTLATVIVRRWHPRSRVAERQPNVSHVLGSSPRNRSYIVGMDGLRAAACLAVFGVHFQQLTGMGGQWGPFDIQRLLANGNTGVALFFLLSGFLLSQPLWATPGRMGIRAVLDGFVRRRIVRIVPAYFLCLTVLVILQQHGRSRSELFDTVVHYLFLHNLTEPTFYSISSPFWALAVIVQFYAIFGLFLWGLEKSHCDSHRRLLTAFAGLGIVGWLAHVAIMETARSAEQWPFSPFIERDGYVLTHSLLAHLPHFVLGVLGGYLLVRLRGTGRSREFWWADLVFWLSAIAVLTILATPIDDLLQLPHGRYNLPFIPLLLLAMLVTAPCSRFTARLLEWRPIRGIGLISYGFYIFHLPCLGLVKRLFGLAGTTPGDSPLAFLVVGLTVSSLVATGSYVWFERRWLEMIGRRQIATG